MIYQPAEDSFLLAKVLKNYCLNKNVLDMGAGSGYLSIHAKKFGAKTVLSADINNESIKELKKLNLKAIKSDLFSNITKKFDLIVFNPPYLPKDELEDLESAIATTGGKRGDELVLRFINEAKRYLKKDGKILLLLSSLTPRKRINLALKNEKFVTKKIANEKIFMEELEVFEISQLDIF